MITWLNKQLNEKPGGSLLPPSSMIGGKYSNTLSSSSKPPAGVSASFKPTFASIDQLNTNNTTAGGRNPSFERSPFRNPSGNGVGNNNLLHTPSSISSVSSSSISSSFVSGGAPSSMSN